MIPIDEVIFFRGVGIPTTNQCCACSQDLFGLFKMLDDGDGEISVETLVAKRSEGLIDHFLHPTVSKNWMIFHLVGMMIIILYKWRFLAGKIIIPWKLDLYPLVNIQKVIENGPVEIVDLPSYKMVIFHSYVNVYKRVTLFTLYSFQTDWIHRPVLRWNGCDMLWYVVVQYHVPPKLDVNMMLHIQIITTTGWSIYCHFLDLRQNKENAHPNKTLNKSTCWQITVGSCALVYPDCKEEFEAGVTWSHSCATSMQSGCYRQTCGWWLLCLLLSDVITIAVVLVIPCFSCFCRRWKCLRVTQNYPGDQEIPWGRTLRRHNPVVFHFSMDLSDVPENIPPWLCWDKEDERHGKKFGSAHVSPHRYLDEGWMRTHRFSSMEIWGGLLLRRTSQLRSGSTFRQQCCQNMMRS